MGRLLFVSGSMSGLVVGASVGKWLAVSWFVVAELAFDGLNKTQISRLFLDDGNNFHVFFFFFRILPSFED